MKRFLPITTLIFIFIVYLFYSYRSKERIHFEYEYATSSILFDIGLLRPAYLGINPFVLYNFTYSDPEKEQISIDALIHNISFKLNQKAIKENLEDLWEHVSIEIRNLNTCNTRKWKEEFHLDKEYLYVVINLKNYKKIKGVRDVQEYYIQAGEKIRRTITEIKKLLSVHNMNADFKLEFYTYQPLKCDLLIKSNIEEEIYKKISKNLLLSWNHVAIEHYPNPNLTKKQTVSTSDSIDDKNNTGGTRLIIWD